MPANEAQARRGNHRREVRVRQPVDKEGLTLKARLGYFAPRAAKSKDGK
jgi:hypothetical protein